jgi:Ca2+-binding RTX toxin-like protein
MDGAGWSIRSFSSVDASGTATSWTVIGGGPGQDSLAGLGPATHLGTPENDTIAGGPGEDTIAGGLGDDTLSGGGGADTFRYTAGDGNDTITDFQRGADRLVLLGVTGVSLVSNGGVATVTLADGSQITLQSAAPLPPADVAPLG